MIFKLAQRTRHGRDINRHGYSLKEAETQLERSVVRRLLRLMEFRGSFGAFGAGRTAVGAKINEDDIKTIRNHRGLREMDVSLEEGGEGAHRC